MEFVPGASAEFQRTLTQTWGLNWLAQFAAAHGKPLVIPEMGLGPFGQAAVNGAPFVGSGLVTGGDDPLFVNDMFQWIAQNNVAYVGYWDFQFAYLWVPKPAQCRGIAHRFDRHDISDQPQVALAAARHGPDLLRAGSCRVSCKLRVRHDGVQYRARDDRS